MLILILLQKEMAEKVTTYIDSVTPYVFKTVPPTISRRQFFLYPLRLNVGEANFLGAGMQRRHLFPYV